MTKAPLPRVKVSEKEIQDTILQYLAAKNYFYYRQNTGAFKPESGGWVRYGAIGSPDIILVINGRYIGIEVKAARGVLSEAQRAFGERLEKAGGLYVVAKSLDDLLKIGI